MTVGQIINNAFDLAGGSIVRRKLDEHQGLLACLNILKAMQMEIANSGKLNSSFLVETALAADASDGTINIAENFTTDRKIILYRVNDAPERWEVLPQVTSFADIASANGRHRIFLTGTKSPLNYYLSFTPSAPLNLQIWLKSSWADIADLADESTLPRDMDLVAVYRLVGYFLNQLLLPETGGQEYRDFVVAQTALIQEEKRRVEHIWRVYLKQPADAGAVRRIQPYEMEDEWGETFNAGEVIW